MSEPRVYLYEGLFLLSQGASANLPGALEHLQTLLERADAEILVLRRWDERRLAYPIKHQKRGIYLIAYFRAPAPKMVNFERDCNLSEQLIRSMCVRADHMGEAEIEAVLKEAQTAADEAKLREQDGEEGDKPAAPPAEEAPTDQATADAGDAKSGDDEKAPAGDEKKDEADASDASESEAKATKDD